MNEGINITSYLLGKKAGGGGEPPIYQDKEVSITQNGTTTITKDSGYDALNSVELTVNVPQPSGKINITQNGTDIDVSSYATADVNVPAGIDPSEYFYTDYTFTEITGNQNTGWMHLVKKLVEPVSITTKTTSVDYMFYRCPYVPIFTLTKKVGGASFMFYSATDTRAFTLPTFTYENGAQYFNNMFNGAQFSEIDASSLPAFTQNFSYEFNYMFAGCNRTTKINLSNFNIPNGSLQANYMFNYCIALTELDISSLDVSRISSTNRMFGTSASDGPADNCLIYVKDQTSKDWFTTNFPRFTNVQIKGA